MLTAAEIAAGSARLTANTLKASDRETLLSVFRLYLKSIATEFDDIAERLAALTDSADVKTAAKLAAVLIKLEESGFGVAELSGDRSGLTFRETDEASLQIRFALTLLGYDLPESFSGSIKSSGKAHDSELFSGSVPLTVNW